MLLNDNEKNMVLRQDLWSFHTPKDLDHMAYYKDHFLSFSKDCFLRNCCTLMFL